MHPTTHVSNFLVKEMMAFDIPNCLANVNFFFDYTRPAYIFEDRDGCEGWSFTDWEIISIKGIDIASIIPDIENRAEDLLNHIEDYWQDSGDT